MLRWLVKFGSYTVFLRVLAIVSTLAFVSVTSFWMDKADYGVLAMIFSVTMLAGTVGGYGLADLVMRDVSPLLARDRDAEARHRTIVATNLATWVSVFPAAAAAAYFWFETRSPVVALSCFVIVVLLGIGTPLSGAARSHNRFLLSLGPKDIFWRLGIMGVCGALPLAGIGQSLEVVMAVSALVLAATVFWQIRSLKVPVRQVLGLPRFGEDRALLTAGFALMISSVCIIAHNTVDVFLVGALMSREAAAEYYPANRAALAAGFFTLPFQMLVAPKIAVLIAQGDMYGVKRLVSMASVMLTVLGGAAAVVLVVAYPVYGQAFATRSPETFMALSILVAGPVLNALLGLPGPLLVMSQHQRSMAWANIATTVIGVAGMVWAANNGSIVAMAVAVNVAIVVRKLALTILAIVYLGVWPFSLSALMGRGAQA